MENDQWQSAVKELQKSVKELDERLKALSVAVHGLSVSSSPSPAPRTDPSRAASESSETGNQHEPPKMTFEDFANEVGLRF